jgi:hypothetical protein
MVKQVLLNSRVCEISRILVEGRRRRERSANIEEEYNGEYNEQNLRLR